MSSEKSEKKKYRVNLPKTSFPMKASLSTREPEFLRRWETEGLSDRIASRRKDANKTFILHDGPPYANGKIHIGHALNKILKDMIVKFRSAQGYRVPYVPGWDCHGLPIEQALLKEKKKRKDQVDQKVFRKEARAYAQKYIDIQREEFKRLGVLGEWSNPYLTMNFEYQAHIARSFYELYEKGFIYRGEKPIYWCCDCETALAEAELEYQDKTSKAIYLKFPLDEVADLQADSFSLLIWTTTPWTLPANVGAAFHPDLEYGAYRIDNGEIVVFARALEARLKEVLGLTSAEFLKTFNGRELVDSVVTEYRHPFIDRKGKTILADYVTATDGTGIVHIAPGHGEDDYVHGHLNNGLPIISPVDEKGRFTEAFADGLQVQGVSIFEANAVITRFLEDQKLLMAEGDHQHSYPFCWRSKTPVIVRSTPQWFLKVDHEDLRAQLLQAIEDPQQTQWFPDWGKSRIFSMIEGRPDWCVSRQRLWGVPIPMPRSKATGEVHLPEGFKERVLEIFNQEGADAWFDRPKSDFLGSLADEFDLETDILDVWFDSGVSHQSVLQAGHALGYPADLYLEGSDQHRGWFQSSLITSMALRGVPPFKQVLTHGFVVDGQGRKMSKSTGNVVAPQEVMKTYGADILRLWVSSCDTDQDVRMSKEILDRMAEAYRKMRNTFRYMLGNLDGFDPQGHSVSFENMDSLDRWALSRLTEVAGQVLEAYENYAFHRIYHLIYEFCVMDLSSFYLDIRKDRLYCDHPESEERRSTQTVLWILSKSLCQLLSPVLVFTADEVWQSFEFGVESSVHESVWQTELWSRRDPEALLRWNTIKSLRRGIDLAIERLREQGDIRSSLQCRMGIKTDSNQLKLFLEQNVEALTQACLISGWEFSEVDAPSWDLSWTDGEGKQRSDAVRLSAKKASDEKCARCWQHLPEVGSLEDEKLCRRCLEVEKTLISQNLA